MIRRLVAAVLGAAVMVGIIGGTALAARAFSGPTFYLTSDATLAAHADQVAAMWSANNIGVRVVPVDDCSGPRCIHGVVGDAGGFEGLAYRNDDGSYTAEVSQALAMWGVDAYLDAYAHEVGHGIVHSLGGGYWHASDPRDLMSAGHYPGDDCRRITRETRDYLAALL